MDTFPKLVMFDLDGTLAKSKQAMTKPLADLLSKLLERTPVAIITGGTLEQLTSQVVEQLPDDNELSRLYLLPTSGAALYRWEDNVWKKVYEERISEKDVHKIEVAILAAVRETDAVDLRSPSYGERIEYRGSQVTFSALGQNAPLDAKTAWDSDKEKRRKMVEALAPQLPGYTITMGGLTSIDITKQHIDKAYGLRKLCDVLSLREPQVLYVGDQLVKDGNDEVVFKTHAKTHPVKDPEDTSRFIISLLETK